MPMHMMEHVYNFDTTENKTQRIKFSSYYDYIINLNTKGFSIIIGALIILPV
jgi:hypothetical protein